MKITVIVASQGKNLELGNKILEVLRSKSVQGELIDIVSMDLPLYSSAAEIKYKAAELMLPVKEALNAQGFVFVAPEYNGSTPPAFGNFLSWVSRSTKEWRDTFNEKPCLIATHSAGGGLSVLTVMRLQLAYLGMNVMGRQIHTTLQKNLEEASVKICCDQLIHLSHKISGV